MDELERDLLSATIDALDVGVVVLDSTQRVIGWNEWLTSASGVPLQQAVGKQLSEIFPDKRSARLAASISDALTLNSSSFLTYSLNRDLLPLRTGQAWR